MVKIIAEFCQNHNGDVSILDRMLDEAVAGGATHAKIQSIFASDLSFRPEFEEGRIENGLTTVIKRPYQAEYDRLKKLELTFEEQLDFANKCRRVGIEPLTTCFARRHVQAIREAGFKDIKVASYDCGSLPLIRELIDTFDQLIVSTGATYDKEIASAASLLKESSKPFALLHCVTIYPTPLSDMHLARMKFLHQFCDEVGLSEHSLFQRDGVKACLAAIYMGATWIERHFTVLAPDQSRDGPVSINRKGLEEIVSFAKLTKSDQKAYLDSSVPEMEQMMGMTERPLSDAELLNRAYYRGRFASVFKDRTVYNWEDVDL
jgi:sialic acid synthase SpsE